MQKKYCLHKKTILNAAVLALLLVSGTHVHAQDLRIYHGHSSSYFLEDDDERKNRWDNPPEIVKAQGGHVDLVVINPNPLLYTYEFKMEDFEIKDDMPDIGELLAIINGLPGFPASGAYADFEDGFIAKKNFKNQFSSDYLSLLDSLRKDILAAKKIILQSDKPESRLEALQGNSSTGYSYAINGIISLNAEKGRFNSPTLEQDLKEFLEATMEGPSNQIKDAFDLLSKQLVENVRQIKKSIESPTVIRFKVPVKEKGINVRLVVKRKDGFTGLTRDTFDQLICVVKPEFARPLLELVPVVNLSYASNTHDYALEHNMIVKRPSDGFKFRVGAMLLYNPVVFGKYKEGSLGFGLGYNIPQKGVLEGFYLGSLLSFKQIFRVGLGVGFSAYPSGLKDKAQEGSPLPADITNLEDVVEYKSKLSGFLTFSISGITLLKK